jgi:hypothetical protein
MNNIDLATVLERLPPVDLAELESSAALLTRRDRKYLVSLRDVERLVERLASSSRVLTIDSMRAFHYESVYFDTPGLVSYLGAAHRRPRRFKVRTRSYLDSGRSMLEIKTRDPRGQTVKQRLDYHLGLRDLLDASGRGFVTACPLIGAQGLALEPVLSTRYLRSTLLLPEGARVTIDVGLRAAIPDGRMVALADMAVIETKSLRAPCEADRSLWSLGNRPIRVSKFCTSLSALRPELPSNKWTQALRRPWIVAGAAGVAAVA